MKPQLSVFKIGGAIIDHEPDLRAFLQRYAAVAGPKVLVHGGGKGASALLAQLGLLPRLVEGRRITDAATLDVVTMFYAGKTNKQIVALLQQLGVNALGLSGADGNVVRAVKRPVRAVDYGFVGDLDATSVNAALLHQLLALGLAPVLCPINHDGHGQLLNTNADTLATAVATALARHYEVALHFCFEKPGVLADVHDARSVVARLTPAEYARLRQAGRIADGMVPKLDNAFEALRHGVGHVGIEHALHQPGDQRTELCLS